MKKIRLTLLCLCLLISAFAWGKDNEDITMVSYEQGWLDSKGTLALKNNSSKEVKNVVFLITYLDMSGKEMDYKEFTKRVSIAPGMTKKLDVPAYEHDRSYHYYKSENSPTGSPAFKVKFQLKDYNVEEGLVDESIDDDPFGSFGDDGENDTIYTIIAIAAILFFISIGVGLYILVAIMAKRRNRSVVAWVLLSIIATPVLMIIILLCIGDAQREEII